MFKLRGLRNSSFLSSCRERFSKEKTTFIAATVYIYVEIEDEPGVKLGDETGETGRERASATTFSLPGMCTMELVNYARCLCWRADQGGLVLNKA